MNSNIVTFLFLIITFSFFQLGESSFYPSKVQNMQVRGKRHLSIAATGKLADRIYKEGLEEQKEKVGDSYLPPSDPHSFGKK
uniref:Uncharacterized protein n=1 Tax=Strongyloides stercoralis TaxID=6248 RepID=A0A0K0EA24_STRER